MRRLLILAGILLAHGAAAAQSVRGTVLDDVARRPVAGALITIVQSNGQELPSGVRTDSLGRFTINTARAGTYRVRAVRIGYRPAVSDPISLNVGGIVTLQITVGVNPQRL